VFLPFKRSKNCSPFKMKYTLDLHVIISWHC
jgi:hypothetical protein